MAKILFIPLPEPGHIFPTLRSACHLRSRGHEVTYLTAPHFKNLLAATDTKLEPLISMGEPEENLSGTHILGRFAGSNDVHMRISKLTETLLQHQDSYDLILLDRFLAATYRNQLDPNRFLIFDTSLPDWNSRESCHPNLAAIVFCPECFEVPKFRHLQPRLYYVEPSVRPLEDSDSLIDFPNDDRPLILAAFGTQSVKDRRLADTYLLLIESARCLPDFNFLLAAPGIDKQDSAALIPDNMTIVEKFPQRLLLQRTVAFITHGGLGSIKEAIIAGVPIIVLPALYDQPFNAMRVRFHGLGGALFKENRKIDALTALVTEAVQGKFQGSLLRMKNHFLAMEKASISQMLIDNHLANIGSISKLDSADALGFATSRPSE